MNFSQLSAFCISLLFATSCINSPDEPEVYADVNGMVTENGTSVSNAHIHIKSHFEPGGFVEGELLDIEINLEVSTPGLYSLDLFRLGSTEVFATAFSDSLTAGSQVITIPDSLLTNGVYLYQVITPTNQSFENNFLINKPDSALTQTEPYTTTNNEGEFHIDIDYLAIESELTRDNGAEQISITDSLQIIIVRDENIVAREFLQVQTNEDDNFVEISID
ncbi:MAG: hypothetical protein WD059_04070 [Balneolaceae bacterium]